MKKCFFYRQSYARFTATKALDKAHFFSGSSLNRTKKNESSKDKAIKKTEEQSSQEFNDCDIISAQASTVLAVKNNQQRIRAKRLLHRGLQKKRIHMLSKRSKTKIRDKMHSFYGCYDKQSVFATLTFIAGVTDTIAIRILNRFLTELRKEYGNVHYIWVAERQTKNKDYPGNIHFHILLSCWVDIPRLNSLWVLQQYNAGIEHKDHSIEEIVKRHSELSMQEILNPFDVKPVYTVDGLSYYLTMYVTKNESSFECSSWHCSRSISQLFTAQLISKENFDESLEVEKNNSVNKKTGELYESKMFVHQHGLVVTIYNKNYYRKNLTELQQVNAMLLNNQLEKDSPPEITCMDYYKEFINKKDEHQYTFQLEMDYNETYFKNFFNESYCIWSTEKQTWQLSQ